MQEYISVLRRIRPFTKSETLKLPYDKTVQPVFLLCMHCLEHGKARKYGEITEGSKLCSQNHFGKVKLSRLEWFVSLTRSQMVNRSGGMQLFHCIAYVQIDQWTYAFKFNSLRPSDAVWRHRSESTLVQVMAFCLTAPSHYPNQCWLIISEVQWQSPVGNFARDTSATIH